MSARFFLLVIAICLLDWIAKTEGTSLQSKGADECEFSRDCQKTCGQVMDAGCICKFGKCMMTHGGPIFGPRRWECKTYKDCPCSKNRKNCFCQYGICLKEKWECHTHSDCSKMAKCKKRPCGCVGNLCESDCETAQDCVDAKHSCSKSFGNKCKCSNNLCDFEKLPWNECYTIRDCVEKGKCSSSKLCDCDINKLKCKNNWKPSFHKIVKKHPKKNCRVPESEFYDCELHILDCENQSCTCRNPVKIGRQKYGECAKKKCRKSKKLYNPFSKKH